MWTISPYTSWRRMRPSGHQASRRRISTSCSPPTSCSPASSWWPTIACQPLPLPPFSPSSHESWFRTPRLPVHCSRIRAAICPSRYPSLPSTSTTLTCGSMWDCPQLISGSWLLGVLCLGKWDPSVRALLSSVCNTWPPILRNLPSSPFPTSPTLILIQLPMLLMLLLTVVS